MKKMLILLVLLVTLTGCNSTPEVDNSDNYYEMTDEQFAVMQEGLYKELEIIKIKVDELEANKIVDEALLRELLIEELDSDKTSEILKEMFMNEDFISNEEWEEVILEIIEEHNLIEESFEALEDILEELYFQAFKDAIDEALLEEEVE